MSQTIDSRIVEMRFDNKQFEAGAKQTMSTLDRLKEALKLPDTSKALEGIDKASKNISLDGISAGIEALNKRFSTLGIVGMRVIENITDGLMNKLHTAINFVTDSIVSGGIKRAMNIENAHFQLQALLKDEVKVQAVMADAMDAVDGTAYAYDEAAKAASQFAASGIEAGESMQNALKGITGVAAMTNSSFEDISRIFTTVAGNGRLMGDQLLQLSSRGLNAASTIAEYFREVRGQSGMTEATIREMVSKSQISFQDFSEAMTWAFGDSAKRANETFTGALSNMKSALARIGAGFISPLVEQNGELVQMFNALRIKINDVKSALVFDEQRSAIAGLAEITKISNDELSDMFATIKANGSVSISDLDALKNKGADAYSALTKYVNGVADGSIRASYAITSALNDLTDGTEVSTADIRRFVEEGKIDLATFTSAMETEFGTEKTLSKQFTDWFLDHIHMIVEGINSLDMTKPMEIFYYWVESVKNVVKGLLSVLSPVAKAFGDVFFSFNADDVITFSEAVERLTAKLKLSERGSKNLHDAFKGLFSILKLVVDAFFSLLGVIIPINKPIVEMGGGFLDLAGSMGRALTEFTDMIRSSNLLKRAFGVLSSAFSLGMDSLSKLIKIGKNFITTLSGMEGTTKLINAVVSAFQKLGTKAGSYIEDFIDEAGKMFDSMFKLENINLDSVLNAISDAFSNLAWEIEHFSFRTIENAIDALKKKIKDLSDLLMSNEGLSTFVTNFKKFAEELGEAFTFGNLLDRLEKVMEVFGKFFNWIKNTLGPAFEDFNLGSAVAAGGGIGLIYAMIKAAKALENVSKNIVTIPELLGSVKSTLLAYQKELKADALLKTAGAIAVLAGALVLLSFADTERVLEASLSLSIIAGVLLLGVSKILDAVNKGKEASNALNTFAKGLGKAMNNFAKALKWRSIGKAILSIGETIALIAASIIALGIMYRKDPDAFTAALQTVAGITAVLTALIFLMSIGSTIVKSKSMNAIGSSILMITASLSLVVLSISKLMKMDLPSDYGVKLAILGGIFAGLAGLTVALGLAARIAGQNQLPKMSSTIKSLAVLLVGTVLSLKLLFNTDLPSDYGVKLAILGGIFAGFGILLLAMAAAAKIADGNGFKAAGTILSMAAFLVVVVGSLFILTLLPAEKMLKGALALGGILLALGAALYGASKLSDANTYKAVLAMAIAVGVITAALGILAMVPWEKLLVSTVALGSILLALALNFKEIAKINGAKSLPVILAMIAATLSIAFALYTLAEQPWESLLAAGVSMSATLLAFSKSFEAITSKRWSDNNVKKIGTFLLMTLAVIPIGVALYELAKQPWEGMLSGGIALSATILAFSKSFEIILSKNWSDNNVKKIGTFLLMTLAVIPIGVALAVLANQPWEGLLAGAAGLSATLAVLAGCFVILSKVKVDTKAIAAVVAGSASLLLIAGSIALLAQFDGEQLLYSCLSLSAVLVVMVGVMAACSVLSSVIGPAMAGVVGLGVVIAELAVVLAAIGGLAQIPGLKWLIDEGGDLLQGVGIAIGKFIGEIIEGALEGITSQLPKIGKDLSEFMVNLTQFIVRAKLIDSDSLASVGLLTAIILALTAAEVINGIASLFGLSLVDVAVELSAFMVALRPFLLNAKLLNSDSMKACSYLANMIISLTASELVAGIAKFFGLSGSLADFGKQLAEFGPHIKEFAETVKDVKPEAVQGAAAAAEIMAEVADKLPATGGLAQKIFGTKSISEFGEELVLFGPAIKQFADDVKDVRPEAVEGAAAAAEIMANLADKLPTQGGLKAKIFGDKSLSEFGEELVKFGPKIAQFATQVKNVNPTAVTGCSVATEIMSNLANNLPNSETLWSKIFGGGQVTLSEFGEELVKFGSSMSDFSDSLSGMDLEKVNGAIAGFKELVDLASYIQGTSATDLVNFSNQLSQIGVDSVDKFVQAFTDSGPKATEAVNAFYNAILNALKSGDSMIQEWAITVGNNLCIGIQTGITQKQPSVISTANSLITAMSNTLKNGLPATSLNSIGKNLVQGLVNGINSEKSLALSTTKNLSTAIINEFKVSLPSSTFNTIGQNVVQALINGMNAKKPLALSTVANLCSAIINKFRTDLPSNTFKTFGENIVIWITQGMDSKKESAKTTATQVCNVITQAFRDNLSQAIFKEIGENAALGLKNGIESKINEISKAAIEAAKAAVAAAKAALAVASPSKVTQEIGAFFSLGMARGIIDHIKEIIQASTKVANGAIEPLRDAVDDVIEIIEDGDFDMNPVIRPVMDLSDVENGVDQLASMMNKTYDLSSVYDNVMDTSSSFNRSKKAKVAEEETETNSTGGDTYEFNQYNYSPKALTRSEIYRQTNNQFSAFRRAVNPTS